MREEAVVQLKPYWHYCPKSFNSPTPGPPSSKLDDRVLGTPGYTAPTLKRGGRVRGHREGSTLTLSSFYGREGPSANKFLSKLREES